MHFVIEFFLMCNFISTLHLNVDFYLQLTSKKKGHSQNVIFLLRIQIKKGLGLKGFFKIFQGNKMHLNSIKSTHT